MGTVKYDSHLLSAYDFKNNVLRDFYRTFSESDGYDNHALNTLCSDTSEITVIKMLAHFDQNLSVTITQLNEGIREQKNDIIERAAHKLIGTAELLGFKGFSDESRKLTNMIRNKYPQEVITASAYGYLQKCNELFNLLESSCPSLKIHL
ncbi:MAG: hypothetical protein K0R29_2393 [Pseudobdellovibrio sp.]|jgi:HPt (histidine-containing phosphotransfer) domain-containing protein|nr:hypothetical protein [Pseudobdellovibrio sp.]